jgi:acetyltransferase-like isoleucine patch superfamily enzyme
MPKASSLPYYFATMGTLLSIAARINGLRPRIGIHVGRAVWLDPRVWFEGDEIYIGDRVRILRGGAITGPVRIGDGTFINRDCYLRMGVQIGDRVDIGPFCRLITDSHEIGPTTRRAGTSVGSPIIVGDGSWIGASVTVLGGVTIGPGAIVAAGSVVIRDVPPHTMVAGVPAKHVRDLD